MKVRENKNIDRQGKKHETLTWYINNWTDSAEFHVRNSHLTLCGLTGNRSEMPNASYTKRYQL